MNFSKKKKRSAEIVNIRYINSNNGGYSRGCLGCSVHGVRVSNRWRSCGGWGRRGRGADVPREVSGCTAEVHRHVLRMGLWLAVAQVPAGAGVHSLRPVRWAVHHAVHCRQHAIHGAWPPRDGPQTGLRAQQGQRCKCTCFNPPLSPTFFNL